MAYDYDGLDELLDKGAYQKARPFRLNRMAGLIKAHNAVWLVPIVVLVLLLASIDYALLVRRLL